MKTPAALAGETDRALTADAFRTSIIALDAALDALPESEHRGKAKGHLAAFAFHAGIAAGHELLRGGEAAP